VQIKSVKSLKKLDTRKGKKERSLIELGFNLKPELGEIGIPERGTLSL
jgi:hypothetical protein